MSEKDFAPTTLRVLSSPDDFDWDDVELRITPSRVARLAFLRLTVPVASIQHHNHHEITVEVFNQKSAVEVRCPPAFDLNTAGDVLFRIRGDNVVSGKIGICLECLHLFDEQMPKYQ